jgi:hypothetical protein
MSLLAMWENKVTGMSTLYKGTICKITSVQVHKHRNNARTDFFVHRTADLGARSIMQYIVML